MIPLVYCADSISNDHFGNLRRLTRLYARLIRDGRVAPFVPHLGAWVNVQTASVKYEDWMRHDFEIIEHCDALLRGPGVSPGADREVAFAESLGVPVFYSVDNLYVWAATWAPPARRRRRVAAGAVS